MRYGLIGEKLGHSYSPFLHRELGGYAYELFELDREELEGFIRGFPDGGLNVTIPYKKAVMPFCDFISPAALAIGSVNTLVKRGGRVCGYNTDYDGFIFLVREAGVSATGKKALILGSGGASLTVRYALRELGAGEITVVSRTGENNYENLRRHGDAEIIVNTTPVGMYPDNGRSLIELELFPHCTGVLELIYNPLRTRLIQDAAKRGIACMGGLSMLASQAAAACALFLDRPAQEEKTRLALSKLRAQAENIVLIGMPGCGKTSVGRELARLTGRELIDTDDSVLELTGRSPADIILADGEAAFRRAESIAVENAAKKSNAVIATGGGAVLSEQNRLALAANGRLYFLARGQSRLDVSGRPLSAKLPELYEKRLPVYRQAAFAEIENEKTPLEAALKILEVHNGDMDYKRP